MPSKTGGQDLRQANGTLIVTLVYRFGEGKTQLLSDSTLFEVLVHNDLLAICAEAHSYCAFQTVHNCI